MRTATSLRSRGRRLPRSGIALVAANIVLLSALLVVLFTFQVGAGSFRVGQVAGDTVVADHRVTYVDHAATAAKIRIAEQAVPTAYRFNAQVGQQAQSDAASFLLRGTAIIDSDLPVPQKLVDLRRLVPAPRSAAGIQELATLDAATYHDATTRAQSLLAQAATWHFDSNQLQSTEIALLSTIPLHVPVQERDAIGEILTTFLVPTLVTDPVATARAQAAAARRVTPVTDTIMPGQVVVRRGDVVSRSTMNRLQALGILSNRAGWQAIVASILFGAAVVVMLFWYLYAFHVGVPTNPRLLILVDLCLLAAATGAKLLAAGHVLLPYFLPVAAASTFLAVLVGPEACIAITLAMAILAGWVVASSFELMMYYFLSGAAAALAIRNVQRVKQFMLAGVAITFFAMVTALSFDLAGDTFDVTSLQEHVLAAIVNGFVSSTLAFGGFVLLSDSFGVTTGYQLLELAEPSHPLLRRLMVKAPGTYNHSLIVASMVERAAEDIGANSLAARLGALYHDAGKSINPHAFVENQMGMGNIHDELEPEESARLIRGHVSNGLRLARQHKLPRMIVDAIAEHHGTMTISYFLHKARQQTVDMEVDPSPYMYPGPKPQSKETALLMLADACESTVRAVRDTSSDKIRETVDRIFQERVESGQLDDCPITIRDLQLAKDAFCAVLNGLYHPRIEYPEPGDLLVETRPAPDVAY